MTVGETLGSTTESWSVDISTSSVRVENLASFAGLPLILQGRGMSIFQMSSNPSMGSTAAQFSSWLSETSLLSRSSDGARGTRRIVITTGEITATISSVVSVDTPSVSFITRQNRASTGLMGFTLSGGGFGGSSFTATLKIGFTMGESTKWVSDSSILGKGAQGIESTKRGMFYSATFISYLYHLN